MNLEQLTAILQILEAEQPKGVGISNLSKKSGVESYHLRKYLAKYKDYFTQLPDSKAYTINNFGRFKGSSVAMIEHHKQQSEQNQSSNFSWYLLALTTAFVLMTAASQSG
ncbi:hypothetical protein EXU30_04895 [Shewanella maritima]|uniref:Uncharacterized protein n=1 Tax=Shewanella maritima TaxID=2520507 RepID=A0A411PEZ3_9GAMM|nr:hypothetical protein [Shewanella maritima]QBF82115.1 hypothetical protein EXU30_04895 [Shewanella maritima]